MGILYESTQKHAISDVLNSTSVYTYTEVSAASAFLRYSAYKG